MIIVIFYFSKVQGSNLLLSQSCPIVLYEKKAMEGLTFLPKHH